LDCSIKDLLRGARKYSYRKGPRELIRVCQTALVQSNTGFDAKAYFHRRSSRTGAWEVLLVKKEKGAKEDPLDTHRTIK